MLNPNILAWHEKWYNDHLPCKHLLLSGESAIHFYTFDGNHIHARCNLCELVFSPEEAEELVNLYLNLGIAPQG